jgi:protein arginine kinase activator
MKCQHCEKPATFHITELTGPKPVEFHLCEVHAKLYLMQPEQAKPSPTIAGVLAQQLNMQQTAADELDKLDQRTCPMCGISFFEFRNQGRLGCPHDYSFFEQELEPLIYNIHGSLEHKGKRPRQHADSGRQQELIRLRRSMKEAIAKEDYESASRFRDAIRQLEETVSGSTAADADEGKP